ncbi:hypothetical protein BJI67_03520 [Acidihalobacter aeolianus]|uniref:diguanylate cyclase n=1 Tax=Acidihalobacter aeolianus TaxID=2792603 RepID=A0A1D8K5P0_9GAMM|nr:GGDEF domain-containing protein [Acidihalobacter aeolianus]AOV16264.1 hypothetical protein BJI67_03520 [Acidihalobacter aeolianus]
MRFLYVGVTLGTIASLIMFYVDLRHGQHDWALSSLLFPACAPPLLYWMRRGSVAAGKAQSGMALLIAIALVGGALASLNTEILLVWIPVLPLAFVFLLGHARAMGWVVWTLMGVIVAYTLFPLFHRGEAPVSLLLFVISLLAAGVSILLSWQHHRELGVYQRYLRTQASYDALTGAMMREPGLEVLGRQMAQVDRRPESGLCVALLDLDDFKRINDEDGHLAGDRVLVEVAAALRGQIRQGDYLVRLGGEEFLLLFPGMGTDGAHGMSEQLRARIPEVTTGLSARPVTASIGLTRYRPGESVGQLLGRADELMYAAKTTGKNRICHDGDVPPDAD